MEATGRPWAQGIGLLLFGLAISAGASSIGLQGEEAAAVRAAATAGYALGVVVAGAGVHRVLWAGRPGRRTLARLAVTALVTVPAFAATAVLLSVLITLVQRRTGF